MATPCRKEDVLEMIREDIKDIRKDVKTLLGFRWQIVGGAGVIGVILSYFISLVVAKWS